MDDSAYTGRWTVSQSHLEWDWPFSLADLTAGLRRDRGDTSLRISKIIPTTIPYSQPSIGRIRALQVKFDSQGESALCQLVVKEPRGTTRTGLAGAGRREVGVYQSLASHLPLLTPKLISASPVGNWLLMEAFPPILDGSKWGPEEYHIAIETLARLHDRFWGLGIDLSAFPWLSRPLGADFEVHVTAAAKAIDHIVHQGYPVPLAKEQERMEVLAALTMYADHIAAPLQKQPSTLLHGDYWPGNIAALEDGSQVVYDWQLTGVGPGVMDLLVFVNKSLWRFGSLPLPEEEIISFYRKCIFEKSGVSWEDDEWKLLWDHALMWRFLQEWVDILAASPEPLLETRAEQLDQIWLNPVADIVSRRLKIE